MNKIRNERLSGEFQKCISEILTLKFRNKFSGLSPFISVTSVDPAPDLKSAKVYISIFDTDSERSAFTFKTLKDNAGFIRHELARIMHIRTVPELRFHMDESVEYGAKIDKILKSIDSDKND